MENSFKDFLSNITLTSDQQEDAQTKYTGVCEKLYKFYYGEGAYDSSKKYLFGSYKTKTNVRPFTEEQDIDVLFKIPEDTFKKYDGYKSNGQCALLQEIKDVLKEKYTTTDKIKAWGKVVLVQFAENHHNVELLPALEKEDGTFLIPNSENGGSWDYFDPRMEIDKFNESNKASSGLTRDLAKMLKAWAHNTPSMSYKSCERMDDIIAFLDANYASGANNIGYDKIVFDFFDYMRSRCNDCIKSYIDKAFNRAQKALEYNDNDKPMEASEEWIKIFGEEFPKTKENSKRENQGVYIQQNPSRPWFGSTKKNRIG